MRRIKSILRLLYVFFTNRPIQTLFVNFKFLPLKQAFKLPIFIYSKIEFRCLKGRIIINNDNVYPNMIHIGDNTRYPATNKPLSVWTINGTIIFNGPIKFFQGTYVYVAEGATLELGTKGTFIGSDSKIICRDNIVIGNNVEITWECQIYDTSFHYTKINNTEVQPLTSKIIIKDFVWVGNRTTISKGTILPSHSIVASNSLCNKDYTKYGEKCLYAGQPAICKVTNIDRIFNYQEEEMFDKKYNYIRYKL